MFGVYSIFRSTAISATRASCSEFTPFASPGLNRSNQLDRRGARWWGLTKSKRLDVVRYMIHDIWYVLITYICINVYITIYIYRGCIHVEFIAGQVLFFFFFAGWFHVAIWWDPLHCHRFPHWSSIIHHWCCSSSLLQVYVLHIYIYRAFDYMSFIYCTLYILYVLIYNIADVSTSTVSVVHPSDPSRWAVEVKVGFRCQAPRCAHCEGTCNCDWKQPLKELIDPWRCIPKQSQRKNNSVISLEIDTW